MTAALSATGNRMRMLRSPKAENAPAAKRSREPEMGAPAAATKTINQSTGYPYCCNALIKNAFNSSFLQALLKDDACRHAASASAWEDAGALYDTREWRPG